MPSKITSPANIRIKELVRLREARRRRALGLILVDGVREVTRALQAGLVCKELFYCPALLKAGEDVLKKHPERVEVTPQVFEKMAYGDRDEGLIAVFEAPAGRETLPSVKHPLYLVLDGLEKPGNIGAILRTADAAGVNGVLICDPKADIYNPNVIRASTGVVFSLPIVCQDEKQVKEFLKSRGVKICAADPKAKKLYTETSLSSGMVFVVGKEDSGVSEFWMNNADVTIRIPMKGQADSLNVSASAAVILYEALRQRTAEPSAGAPQEGRREEGSRRPQRQ